MNNFTTTSPTDCKVPTAYVGIVLPWKCSHSEQHMRYNIARMPLPISLQSTSPVTIMPYINVQCAIRYPANNNL